MNYRRSSFLIRCWLLGLLSPPLFAIHVHVIDDSKQPVESELWEVPPAAGAQDVRLGVTDNMGDASLNIACPAGARIRVHPGNQRYYDAYRECPVTSAEWLVRVEKKAILDHLEREAHGFEGRGENMKAALTFNELYARRTSIAQTAKLRTTSVKIYENVGKALNVPEPTTKDPKQAGAIVASPELVQAVKAFQVSHDLPSTGTLDYKTLSTGAGLASSDILFTGAHQ